MVKSAVPSKAVRRQPHLSPRNPPIGPASAMPAGNASRITPAVAADSPSARCRKNGAMKKTTPMAVAAPASARCGAPTPGVRSSWRTGRLTGNRRHPPSSGTATAASRSQAGPCSAVRVRASSSAVTATLSRAASVNQVGSGMASVMARRAPAVGAPPAARRD